MHEREWTGDLELGTEDGRTRRGELAPGTSVRVANGFDGRWHDGYVVRHAASEGYWLERADGTHLPAPVPHERVAPDPPPLS